MVQNTLSSKKPAQPLQAVLLIISGAFLLLSLISYSSQDPSWNFARTGSEGIQNFAGLVGSFLADALLQSLGLVSYFLVFVLLYFGFHKLQDREARIDEKTRKPKQQKSWKTIVAVGIALICLCGLLSLTPFKIYSDLSTGGFFGYLLAHFGVMAFSHAGAALIFLGGLWASAVIVNERAAQIPKIRFSHFLKIEKLRELSSHLRTKALNFFKKPDSSESNLNPEISTKLDQLFQSRKQVEQTRTEPLQIHIPEEEKKEERASQQSFNFLPFGKPKKSAEKEEFEPGERKLLVSQAPKRNQKAQDFSDFAFPSIQLLDRAPDDHYEISRDELIENSKALEQKLFDFGIQGKIRDIRPGPIITLYEFEPAAGVKVKNIINLADDLKLAMKALSIRIIAPIPGKAAVGIEIPNKTRKMVVLRDIIHAPLFENSPSPLTIAMGKNTSGDPFVADLAKMPHLLMAGATGSGKSVGLNAMIVSMLYKSSPDELKFIMIDPKMLELSVYEGIPHLLLPVVTDPKKASRALAWAVKEMERRYKLISSLGARNLRSYNEKVERLSKEELEKEIEIAAKEEASMKALIDEEDLEELTEEQDALLDELGMNHYVKLPMLVVVIDELADLMMVAGREVEESITRLAQMARAAGIHLILATQRPSVDVITGVIKANFPTRVAYQVASKIDSRTIIDGPGAENLIGDGDLLFLPPGTSRLERLHGPFISEDEIDRVVDHLKSQGMAEYSESINLDDNPTTESGSAGDDFDDELYDEALQVVFETKSASASMIQRRLRVGYNRAARMVERMEAEGIVSSPLGAGKGRELLIEPSYRE